MKFLTQLAVSLVITFCWAKSWSAGNCGGPLGGAIMVGQCVNLCFQNRDLGGGNRPTQDACAKFCGCVCQMDKGALQAQANTQLTTAELEDNTLADRVCQARAWPQAYQLPSQFQKRVEGLNQNLIKFISPANPTQANSPNIMHGIFQYDRTDPVIEELWRLEKNGPTLLECAYGSAGKGYARYYFWYKVLPEKIAELINIDKQGKLRLLGRKAHTTCPDTSDNAFALQQASAREMGFSR